MSPAAPRIAPVAKLTTIPQPAQSVFDPLGARENKNAILAKAFAGRL
jgi:hypothetical protein